VSIDLPNAGTVTGMGIRRGITLVVGGGYHGKSTLLRSLERGVYNHRPGDGRERVVSDPDVVKIRSEDGRAVTAVDISCFIASLPGGENTRAFTSSNASGSTSQAAAIVEAAEAGATALLLDEDTSATNFMIRDRRMQALVPKEGEPITPFVDRVRQLYETWSISSVLVIGGSGDYLEVADTVIGMRDYRATDLTEQARAVVRSLPTGREVETAGALPRLPDRVPARTTLDPTRGRRRMVAKARGRVGIEFGTRKIDLAAVDQLVRVSQTRAVARALLLARNRFMDDERSLPEILDLVMATLDAEGLDVLDDRRVGDLASFRRHELAAALNRARGLRIGTSSA
jgi:predicted ABC-class ATPase